MTEETKKRVIHRGNSVISIEKVEKYPHPVVIKKPSKRHPIPAGTFEPWKKNTS